MTRLLLGVALVLALCRSITHTFDGDEVLASATWRGGDSAVHVVAVLDPE